MRNTHLLATTVLAIVVLALSGSSFGGTTVRVDATVDTSATAAIPPFVEIVVYDGTKLPATVVAGCSSPDCMGYSGPLTGTVTNVKNYVGWLVENGDPSEVVSLHVDGRRVDSARWGTLLLWNTRQLSAGSHTLVARTYNSSGVEGSSTPLTIVVIK